ncbi:hypothetical protein BDV18DRAFT_5120 [Aspergillus unguis]
MGKKQRKPQPSLYDIPFERRLAISKFDPEDCENAIHGRRVPATLGDPVHRYCAIRGIRYHHGFAQELRGVLPEFTRALNARDIMSGIIPTISDPEEMPYCIWHPDVPSEDTLQALVQRYPEMLYHAARACAVAGYIDLYKELDPLPEVHVAEEAGYASAHKNNQGSREIYQLILSQPIKYSIMNDYERTFDISSRRVSPLNGDTAVCSSLEARTKYTYPEWDGNVPKKRPWEVLHYFNITEDWGVDDHDCNAPKTPDDDFLLLYSPLPTDLPLVNKDSLIAIAAYTGDIDRYARLRRPRRINAELGLVIRGIYHNPFFAKWWSSQIPESEDTLIRRAINARRIMSNDISWVTPDTEALPRMIYHPDFAKATIYETLARIEPRMYRSCLQACIAAGYDEAWDRLILDPPEEIEYLKPPRQPHEPEDLKLLRISRIVGSDGVEFWNEAEESPSPHFSREIKAAFPEKPIPNNYGRYWYHEYTASSMRGRTRSGLLDIDQPVRPSSDHGPYDGMDGSIGEADYAVFTLDAVGKDVWEEEKKREGSSWLSTQQMHELLVRERNK